MDKERNAQCSKEIKQVVYKYFKEKTFLDALEFLIVDLAINISFYVKEEKIECEKKQEEILIALSRALYLDAKALIEKTKDKK